MLNRLIAAILLFLPQIAVAQVINAGDLVVSEIFPNPSGGDRAEFTELFNPTSAAITLYNYQICGLGDDGEPVCTALAGQLPAYSYYTICRDITVYAFCNIATMISLEDSAGLDLQAPDGTVVDSITWPTPAPEGQSYARGLNAMNLFVFQFTTPTNGFGFLGSPPDPAPEPTTPMPIVPPPTNPPVTPAPVAPPPTNAPVTPMPITPAPLQTDPPVTPSPTTKCSNAFCHRNADCDENTGTCTCKTGFRGDGQFVCADFNECIETPNPCAFLQTGFFCEDNFGTFTCGCATGYTMEGGVCVDINECSNPDACGLNAFCTNMDGSFVCACNPGFGGDDPSAACDEDINECASNPCADNASCANTEGSFTCTCNEGFEGDPLGSACTAIDNCDPNPCSSDATCAGSAGGFTCTCNPGFTGNGLSCVATPTASPVVSPTVPPITISPMPTSFSETPSILPTVSNQPSVSNKPSVTSRPSVIPSKSMIPSETESPSITPSLSEMPSKTDMPSTTPSLTPT